MTKKALIFVLVFFTSSTFFNSLNAQELKDEAYSTRKSSSLGYGFKKMNNPEVFQGNSKNKKYFEGWYFKMVSADGSSILSVIPGISLSQNGEDQHAFIQIIDGKTAHTFYYQFPIDDFLFSKEKFAIRIGKNYFSEDKVILDIQNDSTTIKAEIDMINQVDLSIKSKKKDIMGWYRFVPFMQCYHGVVSLNHNLSGSLIKDDKTYNFDNGLGYIEKDWGKSMPSEWIWMQSNNFNAANTSFMLSVANIPWLGSSFTGFLGFFLNDNTVQRFGTYTHAKLQIDTTHTDTLKISITDKKYTYLVETYRSNSGILIAPVKGAMDRRISESIDAKLILTVIDENSKIVFHDSTSIAGLEMVGNMNALSGSDKKKKSVKD